MLIIKNQMQLLCVLSRLKTENCGFGLSLSEQVILMTIADRVNHLNKKDKWCCYPSISRLASDTNMSERTASSAISNLSKLGFISYKKGNSSQTNQYKIDVERIGAMFNQPMRYATDVKTTGVAIKKTHRANQADKSIWGDDEETLPF